MVSVASDVRLGSERRFYSSMALVMALVTIIGFGPTYYFAGLQDAPTPVLTPRIHIHGAFCTAWIALLIVQTRLIAAGERRLHRMLGAAGAFVALAILVTGVMVALASQRRTHTLANAGTMADPYMFLIFPISAVLVFAGFVILGVLWRNRADFHKRFMLLATASLIGPAFARIVTQASSGLGIVGVRGAFGGLILIDLLVVALAIYDFRSRGRLHPATLWGGAFLILSGPLRIAIGFSDAWQSFAQSLMG